MLTCPFCGAPETERIDLEGRRFLVFRCLFTPSVDPTLDDAALASRLKTEFGASGSAYFRGLCDRMHLYVTKGPGARELLAPPAADRGDGTPAPDGAS